MTDIEALIESGNASLEDKRSEFMSKIKTQILKNAVRPLTDKEVVIIFDSVEKILTQKG